MGISWIQLGIALFRIYEHCRWSWRFPWQLVKITSLEFEGLPFGLDPPSSAWGSCSPLLRLPFVLERTPATDSTSVQWFPIEVIKRTLLQQWNKEQVWPFCCCCIADLQTDSGRYQLYNNGSIVFFTSAHAGHFHCLTILPVIFMRIADKDRRGWFSPFQRGSIC